MPTEAEWEYAARGGSQSNGYTYAGSNDVDEGGYHWDNSADKSCPVKGKKANELGLYDVSGNIWEWRWDWLDEYSSNAQTNPMGPSSGGLFRVVRGGSWGRNASSLRSAERRDYGSNYG